jgi:hypothetical protein
MMEFSGIYLRWPGVALEEEVSMGGQKLDLGRRRDKE